MSLWAIFGQIIVGWAIADFLSGVFHWFEDRLGNERWPLIGRHVIAPNRLHHREPLAFTCSSIAVRSSTTWIAVIALALLWFMAFGPSWVLASAIVGGLIVNEVHAWAHRPFWAPRWARVLQKTGIIQSPAQHAQHHRGAFDRSYCVLTNWLNPVLDALGFWAWLERPLAAIGVRIHREQAA